MIQRAIFMQPAILRTDLRTLGDRLADYMQYLNDSKFEEVSLNAGNGDFDSLTVLGQEELAKSLLQLGWLALVERLVDRAWNEDE